MAQLQYIGICPESDNYVESAYHYKITFENGIMHNVCSIKKEKYKQWIIKCVELVDTCTSLFGNSSCCDYCGIMNTYYNFDDTHKVYLNYNYTYDYVENFQLVFNSTNLYEMVEYLKEKYAGLLLPVKIARME